MLENMKCCYLAGDMEGAHKAAVDAAPYLHSRRALTVNLRRIEEMTDDELLAVIAADEPSDNRAVISGEVPPGAGETRH
jgi:hypothetical protein